MKSPLRLRLSLLALALPAAVAPVEAGSVTGKFVLDGKPLAVGEVVAFRMRDQFNPREFQTYVMLSATPLDKAALGAALDPYLIAINDPAVMHSDHIGFSVEASGEVGMNARVGEVQYIDSSGKIMGQRGSLIANCKENTATRVACTVKTEKPVKSMDGPAWSVDYTFEADVMSRAAGKPLPAGGGDAGKALLALRSAIGGNDLGKILALLTPEEAGSYQEDWRTPEENLASAKDLLDFRVPKKPKVTGGEALADDRAILEVEGEPYDGGKMLYLVEMTRVDGKWLFASSSPAGMLR
jgi:hypothetical protein